MASTFWRLRRLAFSGLASLALIGMAGAPGTALAQDVCPQRGGTITTVDMNYADMDPTAQIDPPGGRIRLAQDRGARPYRRDASAAHGDRLGDA